MIYQVATKPFYPIDPSPLKQNSVTPIDMLSRLKQSR